MTYEEWEATLPAGAKRDPVWIVQAYRLGLYLSACARTDVLQVPAEALGSTGRDQVLRASDSIGANVAEGYARRSAPDRLRFFEYALGSVYELRSYYLTAFLSLPERRLDARLSSMLSLSRLLLTMVTRERARAKSRKTQP